MPFDFSHTNIGTMPDEDIYAKLGPESMFGITPTMRADINRRDAQDRQDELMYRQLASQGNPLVLALAFPDRFFRQTGQYYDTDLNDRPILRSTYDTPEYRAAQRASWLAEQDVNRSNQLVQSSIRDMMLQRDLEAYNSPTAAALRSLDPETAKRIVLGQTGYTKTYGYGGVPSEAEQKLQGIRAQNEPAVTAQAFKERTYEEEKPMREDITKRKMSLEENEAKLKALSDQMKTVVQSLQNAYDPATIAKGMQEIERIRGQMNEILGIRGEEKAGPGVPADAVAQITARYNPKKYKGQTITFRDPGSGATFQLESDGNTWFPARTPVPQTAPPRVKGGA